MEKPIVSVVVVVHDRDVLVDAMLGSLAAQTDGRFETVVLLNSPTPQMRAVVERYEAADGTVRSIECESHDNASTARNRGVAAAMGQIFYFLDDDTEVPPTGIAHLIELTEGRPEIDIFGGPNLTPQDDPVFAQMTGELLASPLGTGPARSRYAKIDARVAHERHLILCNMAVRRRVFASGIAFPVLFGGEENTLMGHASESGFRLWYSPDLWVYHRRRRDLPGYIEQMVRYGRGRALAMRWAPQTFHLAYLVPVGLLGYLVALVPLLFWSVWWAVPGLLYLLVAALASVPIVVRERRPLWFPLLVVLFLVTHVAYAVGLVVTLLRLLAGGSGVP